MFASSRCLAIFVLLATHLAAASAGRAVGQCYCNVGVCYKHVGGVTVVCTTDEDFYGPSGRGNAAAGTSAEGEGEGSGEGDL